MKSPQKNSSVTIIPLTERELLNVEASSVIYAQLKRRHRIGSASWQEIRAIPVARLPRAMAAS